MLTTLTKMAGGALLLLVATLLIAPRAEAQALVRCSGSFVANEIDVNDDGTSGSTIITECRGGPFGNHRSQNYAELAPWDMTSTCGETSILLFYVAFSVARTYSNGDQLYLDLSDATLCFNAVDGSFTAEGSLNVTGGTGRFEGATGSSAFSASGQTLVADPDPSRSAFGSASSTQVDDVVLAP